MKRLCLSVAALALPLVSAAHAQFQPVTAESGRVVIQFHDGALAQAGLELLGVQATADVGDPLDEHMAGEAVGFRIADGATLHVLQADDGTFVPYGVLGGSVAVDGGFVLASAASGRAVDFTGFVMAPYEVRNDGPGGEPDPDYFSISTAADPAAGDFVLCYVKVLFAPDEGYTPGDHGEPNQLRIKAWDLIVTPALATKLGRPELVGRILGYGKLDAMVVAHEGPWEHPDGQNIDTPYQGASAGDGGGFSGTFLDVKLGLLSGVTQLGHIGTFPNGTAGLSMSTTSCNVGDVNAPWEAAMDEDHPGIAMQLHRQRNGRFEQVGQSWIKHGFFALSNSQCTTCQNPSPGTFLGVGCSDTYGTSNNGDRFWLGPRDEWNPHTAQWECTGSYFDGTPVDCDRDQSGSGLNSVAHRLEVADADLNLGGATYYYEAFYMVEGDQALNNNIGSRRCTMTWNGSSWSFSTPGTGNALLEGPAIERWTDADDSTRADFGPDDGTVIVSVNTTDLGGGLHRYEYAVFNWTVSRGFRSFSVPNVGPISDPYFHDIDNLPANDWTVSTVGKNVTFTFPDVFLAGDKVGGPLDYCEIYNFGFTSSRAPATRDATLRVQDAGAGGVLIAVETLAPAGVALSASDPAPQEGDTINLEVRGGLFGAMIGAIAVNGIPLAEALVLTPVPVPFVGGLASVPLFIPAGVSGLEIQLVAADFDMSVVELSNLSLLAIE